MSKCANSKCFSHYGEGYIHTKTVGVWVPDLEVKVYYPLCPACYSIRLLLDWQPYSSHMFCHNNLCLAHHHLSPPTKPWLDITLHMGPPVKAPTAMKAQEPTFKSMAVNRNQLIISGMPVYLCEVCMKTYDMIWGKEDGPDHNYKGGIHQMAELDSQGNLLG